MDLTELERLLSLLRAYRVTEYTTVDGVVLKLDYATDAGRPQGGPELPVMPPRPPLPEAVRALQSKLDPAYFDPALNLF